MAALATKGNSAYYFWMKSPETASVIAMASKQIWDKMTEKQQEPFRTDSEKAEAMQVSQRVSQNSKNQN
jgi:hypothetical protein